ncbi:TraM recognition domain-containing protein [Yinghuangia sp. ASG 101]|uniref:type IV secretory system conjugative DNA transfer family protein n=1 Tax=Yinghuangia sp. ASG 101 TaxID=2896848 RepID=UPI001E2F09B6|nr:TraM recognition domain-containing protein [Yinghuangia sp. ASG 101]UGQ09682.1 TraM recognition domain-containing protein [Yinghuangia sp. ASG 101]
MSSTIRRRGPDVTGMELATVAGVLDVLAAAYALFLALHGDPVRAAVLILVALAANLALFALMRLRRRPRHVDHASRWLARASELRRHTTLGARSVAASLGVASPTPGIHIGRSVRGGADLWGTWEDTYVEISGPGAGKTSARAVNNIVAAPGPVVVTSGKRGLVDATRGVRERVGRTWVFDPQNLAGERPTWYWNPLGMVGGDLKEAASVTGLITFTQRNSHERSDSYFQPAAETLIALMLFAADAGKRPITDIHAWLLQPDDDTPGHFIRATEATVATQAYEGLRDLPRAQRAGVYGVALRYMGWLAVPEIARWITPGAGREEFPFVHFSRESTDTMYILSSADDTTALPAVCTLTAACVVAAETGSARMPRGRLRKPMLAVLDDAADVAQLGLWPNRYSHYGSRGVIVMMMLQSWAQGVGVWGEAGMAKIWGASSVRVFGSGGSDGAMLGDQSLLAGTFEAPTTSLTYSGVPLSGRVTRASRAEAVLDHADVAALPRDRMMVQFSGQRPVLARSVDWTEGPYAEAIRDSLRKYAV